MFISAREGEHRGNHIRSWRKAGTELCPRDQGCNKYNAEVLVLYQQLCLIKDTRIANVIVMGVFLVIIRYLHCHTTLQATHLGHQLILRTQALGDGFKSIGFFQVLRTHNTLEKTKAHEVVPLDPGRIRINGRELDSLLPQVSTSFQRYYASQ